jgi:hypothetical protein
MIIIKCILFLLLLLEIIDLLMILIQELDFGEWYADYVCEAFVSKDKLSLKLKWPQGIVTGYCRTE